MMFPRPAPDSCVADGGVVPLEVGEFRQLSLGNQVDERHPAIGGMRLPADQSGRLESVDEDRDGAGGQQQAFRELSLGQRIHEFKVFQRVQIGDRKLEGPAQGGAEPVAFQAEPMQRRHHVRGHRAAHDVMLRCRSVT